MHVEILDDNLLWYIILQLAPVSRIISVGDRLDWLPAKNTVKLLEVVAGRMMVEMVEFFNMFVFSRWAGITVLVIAG